MGQRVNVQYSIDIEVLPQEVNRLLLSAFMKLEEVTKTTTIDNVLSLEAIEKIDDIRTSLADVDYMLNDIGNIINGYVAYKTQKDTPATTVASEQPQEQDSADHFGIEDKIARFKDAMAAVASEHDEVSTPR